MRFADAHTHTNPIKGMGIERAGRKFLEVGGWFMAIVSLPPTHYGFEPTFDGYVKSFEVVLKECALARRLGLRVSCLVGLHPADVEKRVSQNYSHLNDVFTLIEKVMNYIEKLCRDGLVDGIGEVGRPHYKALPEAFALNEYVTVRALEIARDFDLVVHLHLEQGGIATIVSIDSLLRLTNAKKHRVVLHHVDAKTLQYALKRGYPCTVPGKYPLLKIVFQKFPPNYMIESDHIDDPSRPGVSSYPWEIVENQRKLISEGIVSREYLDKVNIDNVTKVYLIEPP